MTTPGKISPSTRARSSPTVFGTLRDSDMPRISYVNGRFLPHAKATVHIEDRGYQFADGVYEYIAFYNHKLLDGDLHLKRLARSLKELQIPAPAKPAALAIIIRKLIARNNQKD